MGGEEKVSLFWFRRDLRLRDNVGLERALRSGRAVIPLYILDNEILVKSGEDHPQVSFIFDCLDALADELKSRGSGLLIFRGKTTEVFSQLISEYSISAVYANREYEPAAIERDTRVKKLLASHGIEFYTFNDHLLFDPEEIMKSDGTPYSVYTPYSRRWLSLFHQNMPRPSDSTGYAGKFSPGITTAGTDPEDWGFTRSLTRVLPYNLDPGMLSGYELNRNIPSVDGTSLLGPHLRFGTISIREVARVASEHSEIFLGELAWREFFMQVLYHFPTVAENSFKSRYDRINWRNNEEEFDRWCSGKTGYPIVDAGMRQLNETGYMHNRVRMITAGFLAKHLLIDWRWGEAWFASRLLDLELSSNNGNWQWAAGTGCDAVPYFRIFNPAIQQRRFDPEMKYIRKWVPEIGTSDYPEPMVDHSAARTRALESYRDTL